MCLEATLHDFSVSLTVKVRSYMTEEQSSVHIVLQDVTCRHGLVGKTTTCDQTPLGGKDLEEDASVIILGIQSREINFVMVFKNFLRHSVNDKRYWRYEVLHGIDR